MRIGARVRSLGWLVAITLVVSLAAASPASTETYTRSNGYWIATGGGDVYAFGDAPTLGPVLRKGPAYVDLATTATGKGYWLATSAGLVSSVGDAADFGSLPDGVRGGGQIVAIASRPQGDGYWLLGTDGQVFRAGAAATFAALERRGKQYVDLVSTPSGGGYWAVDADGGVSARGDASFVAPAPRTTKIVAIAATPTGAGYWLLDAQGGVWAFGDASPLPAAGATGSFVDFAVTRSGRGYWLLDNHGNVLRVGDAVLYGALGRPTLRGAPAVAIAVTPFVNHPPITTDDVASLDEDTVVEVRVLANDTDAENDPLSARILVQPTHGTATVLAGGVIRYQPAPNYNGPDQLVYEADDGAGGRTPGTLRIVVRPVNDAPVAVDDQLATDEDTALIVPAPGIAGNDSDVDGDALTAALVSGPANGVVSLAPDGSLRYTPALNFHGADSFRYRIADPGGATSEAEVRISIASVPDAPIAAADELAVDEDRELEVSAPGVLANDTDGDGDRLVAVVVRGPVHGTLTLGPDGALRYTPAADFNGPDSFTYRASDGTLFSAETVVRITVRPVNDAPVAAADIASTQEDVPLTVAAPGVLGNDADTDGDPLTATLAAAPANGTVLLASNGSYVYTPQPNFNGTDSFSYRASDGAQQSAPVTVTITVSPLNDAPVAVNDTFIATLASGASLSVAAPGVLGNDSDPDGDAMTAALVAAPSSGTLTLNANGSFTFAPAATGIVTFTYRARDGTLFTQATVTLNITVSGGGGGGSGFGFGTPTPELFDFESYNGVPATPGHIGRESLGGTEVEILSPDWLR